VCPKMREGTGADCTGIRNTTIIKMLFPSPPDL
jgi:hypothetical protein